MVVMQAKLLIKIGRKSCESLRIPTLGYITLYIKVGKKLESVKNELHFLFSSIALLFLKAPGIALFSPVNWFMFFSPAQIPSLKKSFVYLIIQYIHIS